MDNNRVQIPIPQTPRPYTSYWFDYGRCLACKEPIRHELHLHNHWKKYHRMRIARYYTYRDGAWIEINFFSYMMYKSGDIVRRPVAVERVYV
jgi:hypothetical protein